MKTDQTQLQTIEQSRALVDESMSANVLSDVHIQARINMIQGAIKNVFKKDVHYGVIPGTEKRDKDGNVKVDKDGNPISKPTLYKPGAEQLCVMFRIAPLDPALVDLSTPDCVRYRMSRTGASQIDGRVLGVGVGECSSDEEKYKWRKPVCTEEFDETAPDRRREVWKKYQGKPYKAKQVRMNPADVANTILKMADKRAYVAMALIVTGASDAFNQDIEDLPDEFIASIVEDDKPTISAPERASAATGQTPSAQPAGSATVPVSENGNQKITPEQATAFWKIWSKTGKTRGEVNAYLGEILGVDRDSEILTKDYEAACTWARSK